MAMHSNTLAWKIPWMEEPDRLQSMGLLGVRHDWATSLSLLTFMRWRRKWQPTPVFLPGESQGRGSLVGCRLWGHTESDTTEATWQQQQHPVYGYATNCFSLHLMENFFSFPVFDFYNKVSMNSNMQIVGWSCVFISLYLSCLSRNHWHALNKS